MSALLEGVFRRLMSRPAPRIPPAEAEVAPDTEGRSGPREAIAGSGVLEWIDQDDLERAQAVHLIDQSADGLGVRSPAPLERGWPVLLTPPEGAPIKAVVRNKRRDSSGWILGLQLIRRERRRFDRRPIDRDVELAWQGVDGQRREVSGRVRDVGEGGLQLVCEADIPFRTSILMVIEGWQRFGVIVHIRPEKNLRLYSVMFSGPPIQRQSPDFQD